MTKNKKAKRRRKHKKKMFKLGQAIPEEQQRELIEKINENDKKTF